MPLVTSRGRTGQTTKVTESRPLEGPLKLTRDPKAESRLSAVLALRLRLPAKAMSSSDITFAPPSAGPDTASGSNNSGEVQISTTAHPAAPATNNGQGEATVDSEDGTLTTRNVRRKSRSPSSASRAGAQSIRDAASQSKRSASSGSRRSAFTSRGETGVTEIHIHNPRDPACTSRGTTERDDSNPREPGLHLSGYDGT